MGANYERLSNLDRSFLALESRTTHMHVAGMAVFEAAPLRTPEGGIDHGRIRAHIESKLHLIPRYRQRLAFVPLERYPVWVDDHHFDIDYHVRHASVPRPGNHAQLESLMGRLVSQQLDRSKPMWEIYVVEGLEGDRFGLISKVHHCVIDGVASVDLMAVVLGLAPVSEITPGPPHEPRPAPSSAELVLMETARRTGRVLGTLRNSGRLLADAQSIADEGARRVRAMAGSLAAGWLTAASPTPLNDPVGPSRRFATLDTALEPVKDVKNSLGGTVNDVVLATVAGGVRTFLTKHRDHEVGDLEFRVMAPVSVRTKDERGKLGNQVAMWLVPLPVADPDPLARFSAVRAQTRRLKQTNQALGAATLVRLSAGAPSTLVSLASRLAQGARPFNMTVTNVPGPQFPLHLLEARMLSQYPLVPLWHGHGVGTALFSYDGSLHWGFNGDYDLMPDLDLFAASVDESFAELSEAAAAASSPDRGG